ncbi:large ribosomal subunit protein uL22 [Blattabacterium cuenoti]|uniref:large ribosomal subunit protein uL22 n=1 Tax=Blattabacterium cuenoti TaxID=1653831 RepID=UPI00163C4E37|nr:uL22 family ribosomal protein [Blattabacterium cuenoti]
MKKESNVVSASLNGIRSSPRKMRLVVNLIRNKEIQEALDLLRYSSKKKISFSLRKLLLSLWDNWKRKYNESHSDFRNENEKKVSLYIKEIRVNQGKTLKRLRPVPQGRGHKIKKKSSNIIAVLGKRKKM